MHVAGAGSMADVDVECTRCGVRMSAYVGSGGVRYFRCGVCQRWVSSTYAEVFRADAHVRTRRPADQKGRDAGFDEVKARLEKWLSALEQQDPYRVLGLAPSASHQEVRERYRELAFRTHPDRGGSEDKMREVNLAYERILSHVERRRGHTLDAPSAPRKEQVLPRAARG